jgi:hypothetical protein
MSGLPPTADISGHGRHFAFVGRTCKSDWQFRRDNTAYGDLIAAVLALLALMTLQSRLGIPLVWVFNVWGTADLLYAFYQGNSLGVEPGQYGAAYFIPTVIVPLLLNTHGVVFRILLQGDRVPAPRDD